MLFTALGGKMKKVKLNLEAGFIDAVSNFKGVFTSLIGIGLCSFAYQIGMQFYQKLVTANMGDFSLQLILQLIQIGLISISLLISLIILIKIKSHIMKEAYDFGQTMAFAFRKLFVFWGAILLLTVCLIPIIILMNIVIMNVPYLMPLFIGVTVILLALIMMPMVFLATSSVLEDLGPINALKHSYKLVGHNYFRLLIVFLCIGLVTAGLTWFGTQLPLYISWLIVAIQTCLSLFLMTFYATLYSQSLDLAREV